MRVKRPLSFRLIWSPLASNGLGDTSTDDKDERDNLCSIWFPEAPKGYVALSCVVSSGCTPPPLAAVFCILASSVSPCSLRDCVAISSTDMYAATNLSLLVVAHFLNTWIQCCMFPSVEMCQHAYCLFFLTFRMCFAMCLCDLYWFHALVSNELEFSW